MILDRPQVVAAAHSLAGLRLAAKLGPQDVDIVEVRVDALAGSVAEMERLLPKIILPLLLTVRHPAEGGIGNLSLSRRRELFLRYLSFATLVDIELRSLPLLLEIADTAHAQGSTVIASDHHFKRTPSLKDMLLRQRRAFALEADVFKLAALTPSPATFARMLEFASRQSHGPRALMGMGAFGKVSRLALAAAGSVLNYGYLDQPNAPGQWEARELKRLLATL